MERLNTIQQSNTIGSVDPERGENLVVKLNNFVNIEENSPKSENLQGFDLQNFYAELEDIYSIENSEEGNILVENWKKLVLKYQ